MFGRPVMSEDEMEAINSGGADTAPQVVYSNTIKASQGGCGEFRWVGFSCSLFCCIKINPNPPKKIVCCEKNWLKYHCFYLPFSWVGVGLGLGSSSVSQK